jgi:hypothetical protein
MLDIVLPKTESSGSIAEAPINSVYLLAIMLEVGPDVLTSTPSGSIICRFIVCWASVHWLQPGCVWRRSDLCRAGVWSGQSEALQVPQNASVLIFCASPENGVLAFGGGVILGPHSSFKLDGCDVIVDHPPFSAPSRLNGASIFDGDPASQVSIHNGRLKLPCEVRP